MGATWYFGDPSLFQNSQACFACSSADEIVIAGCLAVIKTCSAAVTNVFLRVGVLGDARLAAANPQALLVLLRKKFAVRERPQAADAPQATELQTAAMLHRVPGSRPADLLALLAV